MGGDGEFVANPSDGAEGIQRYGEKAREPWREHLESGISYGVDDATSADRLKHIRLSAAAASSRPHFAGVNCEEASVTECHQRGLIDCNAAQSRNRCH